MVFILFSNALFDLFFTKTRNLLIIKAIKLQRVTCIGAPILYIYVKSKVLNFFFQKRRIEAVNPL